MSYLDRAHNMMVIVAKLKYKRVITNEKGIMSFISRN